MSNNNNFSTVLIRYMNLLNLNNKELSDATGLSPSVISRYVSGKRMPHHNSEQLKAIARAIYDLSSEGNVINQSYKEILNELKSTLTEDPKQVNAYINRLYTLIKSLNINVKDMAVAISFDDSFIYKILSGKTKPRNKDIFNEQIARYVAKKYSSKENLTMLSDILRKDINSLNSQEIYEEIYSYLLTETVLPQNDIDSFLKKLDELDIDSFNQNIMVDQTEISANKTELPNNMINRTYYGISEMRQADLDFLSICIAYGHPGNIFLTNEIPFDDIISDDDYRNIWFSKVIELLKNGYHIHILHSTNRPLKEISLGFSSWIPFYFTNHVDAYYMPDSIMSKYRTVLYLTDDFVLYGDTLSSSYTDGKYTLTNNKQDIEFYRKRVRKLISSSRSLFKLYNRYNQEEFINYFHEISKVSINRHNILCAPPLYTLNEELAKKILDYNKIKGELRQKILTFINWRIRDIRDVLNEIMINDEVPCVSKEEFESSPIAVSISEIPMDKPLYYSYDLYTEHATLTQNMVREIPNYNAVKIRPIYKNIDIHIFENSFSIINKNNYPPVHLAIKDKKLTGILNNFSAL